MTRRISGSVFAAIWVGAWGAMAVAQTTAPAAVDLDKPFWTTGQMIGESVLFVRPDDGKPARAALLFAPTKILSVTSSDGKTAYVAGQDYQHVASTRELILPAASAIPTRTMAQLTPPKGSQPFGLIRRDGTGDILFGARHEYADMQTLVSYIFSPGDSPWPTPASQPAQRQLPRTLRILRSAAPLKVVLFGDSISAGCNASKWADTAPFQPAYGELLAAHLARRYRSPITFRNHSEGGRTSAWGLEHIDRVAAEKPDLVLLAWGMNDSTGEEGHTCPIDTFIANLKAQMAAVGKAQPEAEFILVASMLPNEQWRLAHPGILVQYRDAMRKLVGPQVAMADLTSLWQFLLSRKSDLDLTGNGVNHPNDFGHRLYAEVIFSMLRDPGAE